jgi:hypothetical protein
LLNTDPNLLVYARFSMLPHQPGVGFASCNMYLHGETYNSKEGSRFQVEILLKRNVNPGNKLYVHSLGDSVLRVAIDDAPKDCIYVM